MKQIYSLFTFLLATAGFAQPYTETFDNYVHPGAVSSYFSSSFTGVENIAWTTVHARAAEDYEITGSGIVLRRIEEGSALVGTFPNGLSQFSFQYRKAFTGAAERKLDIFVNGVLVSTTDGFGAVTGADATVYTYTMPAATLATINTNEAVVVKIAISTTLSGAANTNRQTTIDNVIWAPNDGAVVVDPSITVTPVSLSDFTYIVGNGPSAAQTFEISGTDLNGSDVTITGPESYEVSLDGVTFDDTVVLSSFSGTATTIHTRLKTALAVGTYNGTLMVTGGGLTSNVELALSGSVTAAQTVPTITVSETEIVDLNYAVNEGPSPSVIFQLTGTDLDGSDVTLVSTPDFEMSLDGVDYQTTLTLSAFEGLETSVSVRLKAELEAATYSGTITVSGGGIVTPVSVNLTGIVTPTASNPDFESGAFVMYPNPVSDILYFNKITDVEIYNLNGKKVMEAKQIEAIDVTALQQGFYMVKTMDGIVRKMVKK